MKLFIIEGIFLFILINLFIDSIFIDSIFIDSIFIASILIRYSTYNYLILSPSFLASFNASFSLMSPMSLTPLTKTIPSSFNLKKLSII